jgi:lincosamide nucleotidyltransferase A/C/D/E
LGAFVAAGATAWVDGGWSIDALLGETTREHSDVGLVIFLEEADLVRATLAAADANGYEIDLHPVAPDGHGGGYQLLPDGDRFHYPPPATGRINNHPVLCVDAVTQALSHLGYEPTEKDKRDMYLLHEHIGVMIPPELQ